MRDLRVLAGPWDNPLVEPTPAEIRATLERILASPRFASGERLSRFLRYIVEQTLAGAADGLKEFAVATAVFDRDASYDPRLDAVVRVEAGRLRSRLAEYYAEYGSAEPIVIHVPKGGYVPVFERRREVRPSEAGAMGEARMLAPQSAEAAAPTSPGATGREPAVVTPPRAAAPSPPSSRVPGRRVGVVLAVVLVIAVAAGARLVWSRPSRAGSTASGAASVLVAPLYGEAPGAVDGVAAALSRALVNAGAFQVVAHSRVRDAAARGDTPDQLAKAFDADYTIEGRAEIRGDVLTIEPVLVDARAGRKLWVDEFSGPAASRAALVAKVAAAIAAAVPATTR